MIDDIAAAGPGVKGPTPREIHGVYLNAQKAELDEWMESFSRAWDERGCTIMCDGWTGTTRRSMINFLVYCPMGTVFKKSIDASANIKDAQYLFTLMDEMVEEIGEHRVVQVVTDNEASYKAAGRLLMEKRTHLYWVPCAAHCLDLMLEDIGKDDKVKKIVAVVQGITQFIYSHNYTLSMLRQFTGGREILRAGPTRFASNYIALESIKRHRAALRTMVTSGEWESYKNGPSLARKNHDSIIKIEKYVLRNSLWDSIDEILKIIQPIVKVLKMVDGDDKDNMGYLYNAMDEAKRQIAENCPTTYTKWWRIVDKRWEKTLHHDVHAAGKHNDLICDDLLSNYN